MTRAEPPALPRPGRAALAVAALACGLALGPPAAEAAERLCRVAIDGQQVELAYEDFGAGRGIGSGVRRLLSRGTGAAACPPDVTLAALVPEMRPEDRGLFCLRRDAAGAVIGFDYGQRDRRGDCRAPRRTLCQRVNTTRDAALGFGAAAARAGLSVARGPAGALVLEGSEGHLGQVLGTLGGAAASALGTPAVAAGTAATLVAVGGTLYACRGAPAAR